MDCELNVPSGKGERWITIGAGSKDGWIQTSTKCAEEGIVRLSYRNKWGGGGGVRTSDEAALATTICGR